jgi:hypothetical protein
VAEPGGTRCLKEAKLLRLGSVGRIRHEKCAVDALEPTADRSRIVEIRCHKLDAG